MKTLSLLKIALAAVALANGIALAQTWKKMPVPPAPIGLVLQLRDGRILAHQDLGPNNSAGTPNWYILSPDQNGSYEQGIWDQTNYAFPSNFEYGPKDFSSQVLLDGRTVLIEGGEYNLGALVGTKLGAVGSITPWGGIFWDLNSPPAGWDGIGDAQSVILPNGKYLQAGGTDGLHFQSGALYDGPNAWKPIANALITIASEAAYTLLPNGNVLMVDAHGAGYSLCSDSGKTTEIYDYRTDKWACGPETVDQLWNDHGHELGPAVLMRNGKVLQVGGVNVTGIYDTKNNTWSRGPVPPNGLAAYDAPAALEPNGKVLLMLGPPSFEPGCQFAEFDPGTNEISLSPNPKQCPASRAFEGI